MISRWLRHFWFVTFALACLSSAAHAYFEPPVEYLEDPSRRLPIESVLRQSSGWQAVMNKVPNFGLTRSRFWLRFKLPPIPRDGANLELPWIYIEDANLYAVSHDQVVFHARTGLAIPRDQRDIKNGLLTFRVPATTDRETTYYLSAESSYPLSIPIEYRTRDEAWKYHWTKLFLLGTFFGCLLLAALYNAFLAGALRSRIYFFYSAFVLSLGMLYLASEGHTVEFLWPNWPWWALREMHVYGAITLFFYIQFTREFMRIREWLPRLNHVLTLLVAISAARAIWILFDLNPTVAGVGDVAVLVCNLLVLAIGVLGVLRKRESAPYFLAATLIFNVSYVLFVLQSFGVIWFGKYLNYAPHVGTLIEAILLSLALADRIRRTNVRLSEAFQALRAQELTTIQSEKMSALGRMAGGIAHEINNPLTIIHGKSMLLQRLAGSRNPDTGQLLRAAKSIEQTTLRISRIIKSMRALSRDSARDPLERASVSAILTDTLAVCAERLNEDRVDLHVDPPATDIDILCRSAEISQVLVNLISNARDAVVKLETRWIRLQVDRKGEVAEFSIMDSGGGIPAEIRDRIQEPFFTTKIVGQGTGLGLSISKSIIDLHGGKLWLDTECPNTRFLFTVPLANAEKPVKRTMALA